MTIIEKIFVKLLQREMGLTDQQVWIRNQNRKIPPDDGLYIVVGFSDGRAISNQTYMDYLFIGSPAVKTLCEINRVQMLENLQIDLFSRNDDALLRKWEVFAAIKSFYSMQLQEENFCKIFPLTPSFLNTSIAEGGSMINRFTTTVSALTRYEKVRPMDTAGTLGPGIRNYFDSFPARADDETTIGTENPLFSFTLPLSSGHALLAENGDVFITEAGDYIISQTEISENAIITEDGFYLLTESGNRIVEDMGTIVGRMILENGSFLVSESGDYIDIEGDPGLLLSESGAFVLTENLMPISEEN